MKKINLIFKIVIPIIILLAVLNPFTLKTDKNNKMVFWSQQQKGANIFNQHISREDIKAAKAFGIAFIRLSPDKFPTPNRDFLIRDADNYTELPQQDLTLLKTVLNMCAEEKMPVVLTMLSLPGSRWKQNNAGKDDLRLWDDLKFQEQASKFWKDLASELKNHPAIIAYNILNEPHPERLYDQTGTHIHDIKQEEVQQKLFNFYELIIKSIRSIDTNTPIVLDSSAYGDAKTFKYLKVHNDPKVLYSFHMYEPYEYTNIKTNQGKIGYPGKISNSVFDKEFLGNYMSSVVEFQKTNNIESNRILVGEFGGHRSSKGLSEYFKDLIDIFREQKWHFAFYAFREDTWDGMDYELGDRKLPWNYWRALEKGEKPKLDRQHNCIQFRILKRAFQ